MTSAICNHCKTRVPLRYKDATLVPHLGDFVKDPQGGYHQPTCPGSDTQEYEGVRE